MSDGFVANREVTIGNEKYSVGRMGAFDQLNVAADFRDILVGLAMMKRDRPAKMSDEDYERGVQFIVASRGGVTPEVRERVANTCLAQITRRVEGGSWAAVLAPEGKLMFADINAPELVKLMYASFEHNKLLDFFFDGQSGSAVKK